MSCAGLAAAHEVAAVLRAPLAVRPAALHGCSSGTARVVLYANAGARFVDARKLASRLRPPLAIAAGLHLATRRTLRAAARAGSRAGALFAFSRARSTVIDPRAIVATA